MATVALNSTKGRWLMVSAILASGMAFIDGSALNVILPTLQEKLHATSVDIFWVLNSYLLVLAALVLIGGSLGDILGRKKVFMWGISIFIIGSGFCGISGSVYFLIAFRAVQGVGGALMIPGSLSLISSSINEKERGKAIGTWSAVTTIVSIGGPILGGALGDAGLWRYIFFLNIPIGIATLIILWIKVDETDIDRSSKYIDFTGAAALALGLALVTFGFLRQPERGFNDWQVYGSLIAGIAFLAAFIFIEKKSSRPMMPLKLFSNLTFTGVNLLTFFLYAGLSAGMLFLSLNLVQVQGYTQLESGLTFLPFTLIITFLSRYAGSLADKHGPRLFLIFGPFMAGAGLLLLSFVKKTNGVTDYWTTFFPGVMVFSLGMAFTIAPLTTTVMNAVEDKFSGAASGTNIAITRISTVFANAIFGALAIFFFATHLEGILDNKFNEKQKQEIVSQAVNLGNAKVPQNIPAKDKEAITQQFHESFIYAYGNVMMLSAVLCFTGAFLAMLLVKNIRVDKK